MKDNRILGFKHDSEKPSVDLVPYDALMEIAKVFTKASDDKYSQRNWEHGLEWHRIFNSTMRHMYSFWQGEDIDPEFGLSHLAHAGCNILMLLGLYLRNNGIDDRPNKLVENRIVEDKEHENIINEVKKVREELNSKFNNNEVKTVREVNNDNTPVSLKDSFKLRNWNIDVEYNRNNKPFLKKEEYIYSARSDDGLYEIKFVRDKKLTADEILDVLNNAVIDNIANAKENKKNEKQLVNQTKNDNKVAHNNNDNNKIEDVRFSYYSNGKRSYNIKMVKSDNMYNYKFEFDNNPKNVYSCTSDHVLSRKEIASIIESVGHFNPRKDK